MHKEFKKDDIVIIEIMIKIDLQTFKYLIEKDENKLGQSVLTTKTDFEIELLDEKVYSHKVFFFF